jgi:hypothetical protein
VSILGSPVGNVGRKSFLAFVLKGLFAKVNGVASKRIFLENLPRFLLCSKTYVAANIDIFVGESLYLFVLPKRSSD